jgi:hypothetical protein
MLRLMGFLRRRRDTPRDDVRAAGPFDPRVRRADYESGQSYGQRLGVLLDAMYDASPDGDVMRAWDRFDDAHHALFVVMWAMAEIDNGTLDQYFFNSTGDLAAALPEAARFFAADDFADIFDRALAFFDRRRVGDRTYRQERLDELRSSDQIEGFDQLTDEIYALEDRGAPIYAAISRYIDEHPTTFFA